MPGPHLPTQASVEHPPRGSQQENVNRHSHSGYRIQKRPPKRVSIVCETAPTTRNVVILLTYRPLLREKGLGNMGWLGVGIWEDFPEIYNL